MNQENYKSYWEKGLSAITLFAQDLEATKQYYLNVFGLPIEFEDDASVVFKFGNTLINLLKSTAAVELVKPAKVGNPESGPSFVFTITVDDVDAMCTQLTSRGVKLLNGPMDRPWVFVQQVL